MSRRHRKRLRRTEGDRLFLAIGLGAGAVALALGLVIVALWISNRVYLARSTHATGKVVRMAETHEATFRAIYTRQRPVVRFTGPGGKPVEYISYTGHGVGGDVEVLYDPRRPDEAATYDFWDLWTTPLILAFVFACVAVLGAGFTFLGFGYTLKR